MVTLQLTCEPNRYVSLSRKEKKKLPRTSSFSATTHGKQSTNIHTESEPTFDPTSTGRGSGAEQQHQGTPSQRLGISSINGMDATTSWMSQDFQTGSLEAIASQGFALQLGHHDDMFPDMNSHDETDNNIMLHNSGASSSSLYAFQDSVMASDMYDVLWSSTENSPALSDSLSLMQDARLSADDTNTLSTLKSDIVEGARPSSPCDDTSTMTPDKPGKTVLTLENLDPDTRAEIVDLLCKRKIVTKIEML